VVDLEASVPAAPPTPIPTLAPAVSQGAAQDSAGSEELPPNVTTLLFFALLGLGIGGFGLALEQMRLWSGAGILSTGLVLFGGVCLLAATLAL
jgi:hypothetical protein